MLLCLMLPWTDISELRHYLCAAQVIT
ncbi:unnamed protein product [Ectocarpus sp. CCAP 1310/34]|nr:unnamed protein product [Ectocarpus sp. CCAP 1310/34]